MTSGSVECRAECTATVEAMYSSVRAHLSLETIKANLPPQQAEDPHFVVSVAMKKQTLRSIGNGYHTEPTSEHSRIDIETIQSQANAVSLSCVLSLLQTGKIFQRYRSVL